MMSEYGRSTRVRSSRLILDGQFRLDGGQWIVKTLTRVYVVPAVVFRISITTLVLLSNQLTHSLEWVRKDTRDPQYRLKRL